MKNITDNMARKITRCTRKNILSACRSLISYTNFSVSSEASDNNLKET